MKSERRFVNEFYTEMTEMETFTANELAKRVGCPISAVSTTLTYLRRGYEDFPLEREWKRRFEKSEYKVTDTEKLREFKEKFENGGTEPVEETTYDEVLNELESNHKGEEIHETELQSEVIELLEIPRTIDNTKLYEKSGEMLEKLREEEHVQYDFEDSTYIFEEF